MIKKPQGIWKQWQIDKIIMKKALKPTLFVEDKNDTVYDEPVSGYETEIIISKKQYKKIIITTRKK